MKISVIMPSFLGQYPGCAPNRKQLFARAVDSFIACRHPSSELIIVADGCNETMEIVNKNYKNEIASGLIKPFLMPRHEPFTGSLRQSAIDKTSGDILCNLDTDDLFLPHHLHNICTTFDTAKYAWVYFNYERRLDILRTVHELVDTNGSLDSLCTINVAWRNGLDVSWNNCDGRQDNKAFNKQLLEKYPIPLHKKIYGCGAVVKHTANIKS